MRRTWLIGVAFAWALGGAALAAAVLATAASATPAPAASGPVPLTQPQPVYPPAADKAGIVGKVNARLDVDQAGRVTQVDLIEEDPAGFGFGEAATAALKSWTFEPNRPGRTFVTLEFRPAEGREAHSVDRLPTPPKVLRKVPPKYPSRAATLGVNGVAVVVVQIAEDGTLTDARVTDELPPDYGFAAAALTAARQWAFAPGYAGLFTIHFKFTTGRHDGRVNWYDLAPAPEPILRVDPVPPPQAVANDRHGYVRLALTIDGVGRVSGVKIIQERPEDYGFGDAAKAAVEQWRFDPASRGTYRMKLTIAPP
ncbi:MAG: TonB family protein [Alphaproteobacteria bacterium]|nr:TonB family protein [Alphaproteobacteria bacterium]